MACCETSPKQVSPPVYDPIAEKLNHLSYRLRRLIDMAVCEHSLKIRKTRIFCKLNVIGKLSHAETVASCRTGATRSTRSPARYKIEFHSDAMLADCTLLPDRRTQAPKQNSGYLQAFGPPKHPITSRLLGLKCTGT